MPAVILHQADARLLYLALVYHLARPGSELDRETKRPLALGLLETARSLHDQINNASATLDLAPDQAQRLTSAILGTVNELKVYRMLPEVPAAQGGGRRSMVEDFDSTLRALFPAVESDPEATLELAARLVVLRRRLQAALAPPPQATPDGSPTPARGGRWRFWRR